MERCDVLIVGGGPAGSSCARQLTRAGCDVAILDKAAFPRDKVCTGWITPAVVRALDLDLSDYGASRTLQPFTGFQTGGMDGDLLLTDFHRTISYGIRRCEFDDYLLRRSGARLCLGRPLLTLRREGDAWVANDAIRAAVVIGAGRHFCPVARRLEAGTGHEDVIVAQEAEYQLDDRNACRIREDQPALFFWPDLRGYGWCVRKGAYVNVGAGHLSRAGLASRVRTFAAMLRQRGMLTGPEVHPWKGHAYLLAPLSSRPLYDTGVLLAGDAAGLALAPSGEGILAAVESGLIAAETILASTQDYSRARLAVYADRIDARFGRRGRRQYASLVPDWLTAVASRVLLKSPRLTRRLIIEDGFLHLRRAPISVPECRAASA